MIRSNYCLLHNVDEQKFYHIGECPYDSGGYFIVKGSEKVLIAQERMAFNQVYVFKKSAVFNYFATVTSHLEKSGRLSEMEVRMYPKSMSGHTVSLLYRTESAEPADQKGPVLRVKLPYVKTDIPIVIVFRALGVVPDRDVLDHICFRNDDHLLLEMLQPSIEEAFYVQTRDTALDFIGRRGQVEGGTMTQRQRAAFDVLQMSFLPHVSTAEGFESRKAYYLGYMANRLCSAVLGRRELDDRDHFGNKRMDLGGPLLGQLFRKLFQNMAKGVRDHLKAVSYFLCSTEVRHTLWGISSEFVRYGYARSAANSTVCPEQQRVQAVSGRQAPAHY